MAQKIKTTKKEQQAFTEETDLIPEVASSQIAFAAVEESEKTRSLPMQRKSDLIAELDQYLSQRAYLQYYSSEEFHKKIKAHGNKGRDNLHLFMRHWAEAWIKDLSLSHSTSPLRDGQTASLFFFGGPVVNNEGLNEALKKVYDHQTESGEPLMVTTHQYDYAGFKKLAISGLIYGIHRGSQYECGITSKGFEFITKGKKFQEGGAMEDKVRYRVIADVDGEDGLQEIDNLSYHEALEHFEAFTKNKNTVLVVIDHPVYNPYGHCMGWPTDKRWSRNDQNKFAKGGSISSKKTFDWKEFEQTAYRELHSALKGKNIEVWKNLSLHDKASNKVYRCELSHRSLGRKGEEVLMSYKWGIENKSVGWISWNSLEGFTYTLPELGLDGENLKFSEGGSVNVFGVEVGRFYHHARYGKVIVTKIREIKGAQDVPSSHTVYFLPELTYRKGGTEEKKETIDYFIYDTGSGPDGKAVPIPNPEPSSEGGSFAQGGSISIPSFDEYQQQQRHELGEDFDETPEAELRDDHYQIIEKHIKRKGVISQHVYDSLDQKRRSHFDKHYNFFGDKVEGMPLREIKEYPKNFKYKESHWEGSHTSYSWQSPGPNDRIVGETKECYLVYFPSRSFAPIRMKKENIKFGE
jgi:hypothetical protein